MDILDYTTLPHLYLLYISVGAAWVLNIFCMSFRSLIWDEYGRLLL